VRHVQSVVPSVQDGHKGPLDSGGGLYCVSIPAEFIKHASAISADGSAKDTDVLQIVNRRAATGTNLEGTHTAYNGKKYPESFRLYVKIVVVFCAVMLGSG